MSVSIRLTRIGSTHDPRYRIVAITKRAKRDGKFLDILGYYHPRNHKENQFKLDLNKYAEWVSKGAQPSSTVASIARKASK